ncbi:hypothetical protein D9757_009282 [Collybiopsis confluens]|uniref:Uncharacterized protein n=1 Tax=Collybiopsis confluens TaxID=2823264 RepID=A0A8H5HAE0_9AGAR|nr:hypothetical protein D9757_009282 [Collybiopsis confluens]
MSTSTSTVPKAEPEIKQPLHPSIIPRLDPEYVAFHNKYVQYGTPPEDIPWDPVKIRGGAGQEVGARKPLEVGKIEEFELKKGGHGRKMKAYTPHGEAPEAGWPIMIYFHGGASLARGGTVLDYNATPGGFALGGIDGERSIITNFCVGKIPWII